jgi:spore germination protein
MVDVIVANMRRWFQLTALALACCTNGPSMNGRSPTSPSTPARTPEVLAWVLPYEDSLASLRRNAEWLTVVSPTYFRIAVSKNRARLEDWDPAAPFPRARLAEIERRSSFEVLPLVGCIDACGPMISRILDDDAARTDHIDDLVRTVREQKLSGLFIDYEELNASEENVTRFVTDLAAALHREGKRLGVVIQEPCGIDPACHRAPFPFSPRTLARQADLLVVMEYDFSVDGSAPPAPRAWVERGLSKMVAEIDARDQQKLLCALPLYGRLSAILSGGDTAVLFRDVQPGRIRNARVAIGALSLDPEAMSKVATVSSGSHSGKLYLEDRETLAARLSLVSPYGIGGIALWRLGGEDPCTSRELARLRQRPLPPCE